MKIVISGGTGFLGSRLLEGLRGARHTLLVLTRRPLPREAGRRGVTYLRWEGKRSPALADVVDGADVVMNFTGESIGDGRWTASRKEQLLRSRIDPTEALVEAMGWVPRPPGLLLNASGVGIYGDTGDEPVTEEHPPGSGFLADLCVAWERAAMKAEESGVRVVPLRTGLVLGERGGVLGKLSMPYHLFMGGPLGPGTQWFPWVHAADFVRAVLHVMDRAELRGPVNLAAPQPATMSDLARALGRAMRRPSWLHIPGFALRAALGEMSETVLVGQKVVPARLERSGFEFIFPTLEGALAEIYRPEKQEAFR